MSQPDCQLASKLASLYLCRQAALSDSFSQSISQTVSQADNQPVNQSVSRFSQSVSESISQSVSQLVRQSVNQSVSYSVSRTVSQSVSHFLSSVISPLSYSSHPQANHCTKHHDPEIIWRKCTQYSASKNHHSTSKDFLDKAKHIDLIDNRSI